MGGYRQGSGRKPKPINIRIIEGNREHRPINGSKIKADIGAECPDTLGETAKYIWHQYAPEVEKLGLLKKADEAAFATLCNELGKYWDINKQMQEEGIKTGLHAMADKSLGKAKALFVEFGLTPSARTRLSLGKEEGDEFDDLIPEDKKAL